MVSDLETRAAALRTSVHRRAGRRDEILARAGENEQKAEQEAHGADVCKKAAEVIQAAIETRRQDLRDRVERLVTRGLRAVFQRADYDFSFKTKISRGVLGIQPVLKSRFQGRDLEASIVDGHGGGIADVVSFLLRVVVLSLARPKLAPLLVLDEPFRHVSPEYVRGCSTLIKELNRSAGIQFLIVTHKADLLDAADVVYRTKVTDGVTEFVVENDLKDDVFHQKAAAGVTKPPPPSTVDQYTFEDVVRTRQATGYTGGDRSTWGLGGPKGPLTDHIRVYPPGSPKGRDLEVPQDLED